MPSTFNGTGTKYYGEREHDRGGMYITTKWIVLFGLPLVPLSSCMSAVHLETLVRDLQSTDPRARDLT